ncbi:MAG: Zn-ribbon domain-containing OB-fold protein [Actinomycetota bacterium]
MLDKPSDPAEIRRWRGEMPVAHRYTAGVAGERFLRTLKERGIFLASVCDECGITYCPPQMFCERCLAEAAGEEEVGPQGTLESFTVVFQGLGGETLDDPVVVGLVRLDGADTLLLHRIGAVEDAVLEIGMRVEPVLRPPAEREGGMGDIVHFRPLTHGAR